MQSDRRCTARTVCSVGLSRSHWDRALCRRADTSVIWWGPVVLGLPFFMPLAVFLFEFASRHLVPAVSGGSDLFFLLPGAYVASSERRASVYVTLTVCACRLFRSRLGAR